MQGLETCVLFKFFAFNARLFRTRPNFGEET
jgi:hypothetical protein